MKKMKVFKVYVDDGKAVFKILVPAFTKKDVENYVAGSGEIISVTETFDYPLPLANERISFALKEQCFGEPEIEIITRALSQLGLAD